MTVRDLGGTEQAVTNAGTMKIARIDAWWVQLPIPIESRHRSDFGTAESFDAMVVRVETECGIVGYGEGKNAAGSDAVLGSMVHMVRTELAPQLIGEDPRRVARLWDRLYNGKRFGYALERGRVFAELARRGVSIAAISAIDIACWDILAKSLGAPVSALLGGARSDSFPVYASGGWSGPADIGEEVVRYKDSLGSNAVKMRVGVMDASVEVSIERVRAAREALGTGVELMCDAHGTFSVPEAKRFADGVRECGLTWLEEPVAPDNRRGQIEVRACSSFAIAMGESESTRFDFGEIVANRTADVLQPDLAVCGGITEGARIAALAATYDLELSPHMWAGGIAFAAGLHVAAASPGARIIEYPSGSNPMLDMIFDSAPFVLRDGRVTVPTSPGLGVEVDDAALARFAMDV